jgi:hypothetical protein
MPTIGSIKEVAIDTAGYAATREVLHRVIGGMVKRSTVKEAGMYAVADLIYIYFLRGGNFASRLSLESQPGMSPTYGEEMQKSMSIFLMLTATDVLLYKHSLSASAIDNAIAVLGAGVVNNYVDSMLPIKY